MNLVKELAICLIYSVFCVFSLYVFPTNKSRDHPKTVRSRIVSMTLVSLILLVAEILMSIVINKWTLEQAFTNLFLRTDNVVVSIVVPLLLTAILFLGPLLQMILIDGIDLDFSYYSWLLLLRNLVFGPANEEIIFRSCMLSRLLRVLPCYKAIFMAPLFFGVAHLHHIIESRRNGLSMKDSLMIAVFQLSYTTVFGVYCGFLALRTGNILSSIVVHSFCNFMGFPYFADVLQHPNKRARLLLSSAYLIGLLGWLWNLYSWTDPSHYGNTILSCIW